MKKLRIREQMEKYYPPGRELKKDLCFYRIGLWCAVGYSCLFTVEYKMSWYSLHTFGKNGKLVVIDGAMMPSFAEMVSGYLNGFYLLAILMLEAILFNYWYHRKGSKSVYIMKRLPNPWEYHKRCITLPLLGAINAIIMAGLMMLVYYGIYMHNTPAQCMPL